MCTAVTYKTKDFYFGRTLDYDFSYAEEVTVTPRNYSLHFRMGDTLKHHYAILGMAFIPDDYPLYYDAVNEKGLCMAGLNFVGNAYYGKAAEGRVNLAQFEFLPYLLATCDGVEEALPQLEKINLTNLAYRPDMPTAQLHWLIADKKRAVTVEFVKDGRKIYDNPLGVLTNNPTFDRQLFRLNDYRNVTPKEPKNGFPDKIGLTAYSRGMGAIGLPGDWSSQSRFVRASFVKLNSPSGGSEEESVNQFFHILGAVGQPRGTCVTEDGGYEHTIYTSCCNTDQGVYYYTTYENHALCAVDMRKVDLESNKLVRFPVIRNETILYQN